MIPEFDEHGNLPPGVYWAEWEEFKERFGTTPRRSRMIDGLQMAMEQLKAAGCRTIYINGSFVTSKLAPQDFDACWDREDVDMNYLKTQAPRLRNYADRAAQKAFYRGEIFPSDQPVGSYDITSYELFQRDRERNPKGIIAIDLVRWSP
ncbi:DUF6932 family protein [Tychonema sp. BBK16]|uniref:DUF6932 family protein n=1 Tax=Tychonema sp. BBK16 TaxID=2699888 RepID=UPI001F4467D0|nr:hypothetical protein [Tychonema sp. BBK16]MCF6374470.1 hypothetical protein [Tychonema sp. BBK16]